MQTESNSFAGKGVCCIRSEASYSDGGMPGLGWIGLCLDDFVEAGARVVMIDWKKTGENRALRRARGRGLHAWWFQDAHLASQYLAMCPLPNRF